MTKDDIIGFSIIPLVIIGIIFREDLFDFVGILLSNLFSIAG